MVRKLKISTKKPIGFRISDIGPMGKESNIKISTGFKESDFKKRRRN